MAKNRLYEADALKDEDDIGRNLGLYVCDNMPVALFVACLQLFSALAVEGLNMILITGMKSPIDCVMNFVALKVISEIDNIYAESILEPGLKGGMIMEGDWQPKIVYGWVPFD